MKINSILIIIVSALILPSVATAGEMVVIGNPSVSTSELRKQDIKYIFLGVKTKWDDGSDIVFVIQKDYNAHADFLKTYIHKTTFQFANYWKKQIFTGKGFFPQTLLDDQEIIKFVSSTNGAIGYVSSSVNLSKVKTIRIK